MTEPSSGHPAAPGQQPPYGSAPGQPSGSWQTPPPAYPAGEPQPNAPYPQQQVPYPQQQPWGSPPPKKKRTALVVILVVVFVLLVAGVGTAIVITTLGDDDSSSQVTPPPTSFPEDIQDVPKAASLLTNEEAAIYLPGPVERNSSDSEDGSDVSSTVMWTTTTDNPVHGSLTLSEQQYGAYQGISGTERAKTAMKDYEGDKVEVVKADEASMIPAANNQVNVLYVRYQNVIIKIDFRNDQLAGAQDDQAHIALATMAIAKMPKKP